MSEDCRPNVKQRRPKGGDNYKGGTVKNNMPQMNKKMNYRPQGR